MDDTLKFNSRLLKDTKRFIELYRREGVKEHINNLINSGLRVTFQGRPLLLYAKIISETAREEAMKHPELTAAGLPGKYELLYNTSRANRKEVKNLLEQATFDERKFHFIESALNQNSVVLPKESLTQLAETDKLPESPEKAEKMEKEVVKTDQQLVQTPRANEIKETPEPIKTKEVLITPEEINTELLGYKETSKKEVKYIEKEHPKFSSPEDIDKLEKLTGQKPQTPEKIIIPPPPPKPVLVNPQGQPLTPKPSEPILKEPDKVALAPHVSELPKESPPVPEKVFGPAKSPEIIQEHIPTPVTPKTNNPPKAARSPEVVARPIQKTRATTPISPKVSLPKTKIRENLTQKISSFKKVQVPYPLQNFAKNTLSFGKRLIIRNTPTVVSATIGGFAGGALAGPTGIIPGFIGGGLFPKLIKGGILQKGAGASVVKGAGKLALKGVLGPVGWAWLALSAPGVKTAVKYAVIAFLAIFLMPMFLNLNKSSSLFPPYDTAYSAPLPPGGNGPGGGGDIGGCQFTRDDQTPKDAPFNSTTLLGYFQEVSRISGVPAVLLAAIARVESPSSVTLTNPDIASYANNRCAISATGALGIMQIQPPNTTGYFAQGIEFAAKQYLNTTPDKLTQADFCDPRKNVLLSAGFIIKKTHALLGTNGDRWNNSWLGDKNIIDTVARGYYGCLEYGGSNPQKCEGSYNYGNDLWKSIQSCQTPHSPVTKPTYTASCPVLGGTISTPSYFANKSTGHCGSSYKYECNCGTTGRRAKAIDVPTNGQDVLLPTIEGKQVTWSLLLKGYPVDAGEGGGVGHTFEAKVGKDWWYLDILHMQQTGLNYGNTYTSGTAIGKSAAAHAHMTIGKNNTNKPTSPGLNVNTTDCDPGWVASDFLCQ